MEENTRLHVNFLANYVTCCCYFRVLFPFQIWPFGYTVSDTAADAVAYSLPLHTSMTFSLGSQHELLPVFLPAEDYVVSSSSFKCDDFLHLFTLNVVFLSPMIKWEFQFVI